VLQRILRLEALDGHLAGQLYSILQNDKTGVTYDNFVITLASVIKVGSTNLRANAHALKEVTAPCRVPVREAIY
jgi:hypothetical protein